MLHDRQRSHVVATGWSLGAPFWTANGRAPLLTSKTSSSSNRPGSSSTPKVPVFIIPSPHDDGKHDTDSFPLARFPSLPRPHAAVVDNPLTFRIFGKVDRFLLLSCDALLFFSSRLYRGLAHRSGGEAK